MHYPLINTVAAYSLNKRCSTNFEVMNTDLIYVYILLHYFLINTLAAYSLNKKCATNYEVMNTSNYISKKMILCTFNKVEKRKVFKERN